MPARRVPIRLIGPTTSQAKEKPEQEREADGAGGDADEQAAGREIRVLVLADERSRLVRGAFRERASRDLEVDRELLRALVCRERQEVRPRERLDRALQTRRSRA